MFRYTKEQCESMAFLYRAQMYCMKMAPRQRGQREDEYRRAYSHAAVILQKAQEDIGNEGR